MDPDQVLHDARKALMDYKEALLQGSEMNATDIAADALDLFEALDYWLATGGFLPRRWQSENT